MAQEQKEEGAVTGSGTAPEVEQPSAETAPVSVAPPATDSPSPAPDKQTPNGEGRMTNPEPGHPDDTGEQPTSETTPEQPPEEPKPDEATLVRMVLQKLLGYIGVRARIDITLRPDGYYANIKTKRSNGLLIGRRGQTLRSVQHLTRLIVKQDYPNVPSIAVDVSGYRLRRENFLRKKATAVARIVLETHREMALDLLTQKEMELVREALKPMEDIRVYAVGTGTRKNVIIALTSR